VNAGKFEGLPMILETPESNGKGYKENIERIRELRQ